MKQLKSKLITVLLIIGCLFTSVGLWLAVGMSAPAGITVSADDPIEYTTITIDGFKLLGNSVTGNANARGNKLHLTPLVSTDIMQSDTYELFFEPNSGVGFTVNGVSVAASFGNRPNSTKGYVYITFDQLSAGDTVHIGGTFYNAEKAVKYVCKESAFLWNGTEWVHVFLSGALTINETYNHGSAAQVYVTLPQGLSGSYPYSFREGSGIGLTRNGTPLVAEGKVKSNSSGTQFEISLSTAASVNDIIVIEGEFYYDDGTSANYRRYIIEKHEFMRVSGGWADAPGDDYYTKNENLGFLKLTSNSGSAANAEASKLRLKPCSPSELTYPVSDMTLNFDPGSGVGFTVNGVPQTATYQHRASIYFQVNFTALNAGDIVKIGGTFYNVPNKVKFVVPEHTFKWNGTGVGWVNIYNIGTFTSVSKSKSEPVLGFTFPNTISANSGETYTLLEGSGVGVMFNGKSVPFAFSTNSGGMKVTLPSDAVGGDKLVIEGAFYYDAGFKGFAFEKQTFTYCNEAWWVNIEALSETEYTTTQELGALRIHSSTSANGKSVYLQRVSGSIVRPNDPSNDGWTWKFVCTSGIGITLNGDAVMTNSIKFPSQMYFSLPNAPTVGDILKVGGTFCCVDSNDNKYIVDTSSFRWNGSQWVPFYLDEDLETYDVITLAETNCSSQVLQMEGSGKIDKTGIKFTASAGNTTNSLVFRFTYQVEDITAAQLGFRLRGTAWNGFYTIIRGDHLGIWMQGGNTTGAYALESNVVYNIELAAIDILGGTNTYEYIKINGEFAISRVTAKTQVESSDKTYSTFTTNNISIYGSATYNSKTTKTTVSVPMEFDFNMEAGAAVRIASTADKAGLRFTSSVKASDITSLRALSGIKSVNYGTLILPYDYLTTAEVDAPNLTDFDYTANRILKIQSTVTTVDEDGYIRYYGAIVKMYEANYGRNFAARGYIEVTFDDDTVWTFYTDFDADDNVRSVRYVAQAFQADTEKYDMLNDDQKAIVDAYALVPQD